MVIVIFRISDVVLSLIMARAGVICVCLVLVLVNFISVNAGTVMTIIC